MFSVNKKITEILSCSVLIKNNKDPLVLSVKKKNNRDPLVLSVNNITTASAMYLSVVPMSSDEHTLVDVRGRGHLHEGGDGGVPIFLQVGVAARKKNIKIRFLLVFSTDGLTVLFFVSRLLEGATF